MIMDTGGQFFKVDIILDAYSQLRISGITVDPTPEDLEVALSRLEDMAAEFHSRNMDGGFNFEDQPDPNSDSGIQRAYKQAYATNLAIRLVPDFNKDVPQILFNQAVQSASNLSGRTAKVRMTEYPGRQARGSGNTQRFFRWQRFYRHGERSDLSDETNQIYSGDVNDYVEHFDAYLDKSETIASFTIEADSTLTISNTSNNDTDVLYRVTASSEYNRSAKVFITVTTSAGRVTTRIIEFEVTKPREAR